jgi:hypothetical protein
MAGERTWPILRRCASPTIQRLLPGCAAFHTAPVTTHHTNPNHTSAPKSAVMIVYHHSGQVKVQNRSWNLTLSVFWMMKIRRTPRGRSATRSPHHSVAPVRLLPTRLNRHHVLLMSRSTGGFGATVCHLGGAAALAVASSSATTAPAGRHATRPIAPSPQDRWGNVAAGADVTLENPARTSSKISTAPDGSSPAQELDAPLLEQSNWVAYRLRPAWGPKTQNA